MSKTKLTREQEVIAFHLIKSGGADGEKAKEMFVYCNQPLVGSRAHRYRGKGLTWEALVAAGNIGMMQAMKSFDPSLGNKFATYAVPWIDGAITDEFKRTKKRKMGDRSILQTENGVPLVFEQDPDGDVVVHEPPSEEVDLRGDSTLADHIDLREAAHQDAEVNGGLGLSPTQARAEGIGSVAGHALEAAVDSDDPITDYDLGSGARIDFAADNTLAEMSVDTRLMPALEQAIKKLEPRQAKVFAMHRGLCGYKQHTLAEIGAQFGFSAQRAQAIFKSTFTQLRNDPALGMLFELTR